MIDQRQGRAEAQLTSLTEPLAKLLPQVKRVIHQTVRRVFEGESVPAPFALGVRLMVEAELRGCCLGWECI